LYRWKNRQKTDTRIYLAGAIPYNRPSRQQHRKNTMHCAIYKGPKKVDHYLYVEEEDNFERVPQALLDLLGPLELVITLELGPERKLAQADADEVRNALKDQGYFLQMPPKTDVQNLLDTLPGSKKPGEINRH
jgi:uncharacterized protein YcgL (UPF0745 family)